MASQNIVVELGARIDRIGSKLDLQKKSLAGEMRAVRWMLGAILALSATLTALSLFNALVVLSG